MPFPACLWDRGGIRGSVRHPANAFSSPTSWPDCISCGAGPWKHNRPCHSFPEACNNLPPLSQKPAILIYFKRGCWGDCLSLSAGKRAGRRWGEVPGVGCAGLVNLHQAVVLASRVVGGQDVHLVPPLALFAVGGGGRGEARSSVRNPPCPGPVQSPPGGFWSPLPPVSGEEILMLLLSGRGVRPWGGSPCPSRGGREQPPP